ncbi:alpha/beta fold hydrolase [Myxosarcina sp. GI1]|uniref:alpha/beta fold hydrolase n=1 Tax=Myxosarcina sp. GI1 TaxID=1541065 RepID=UPI0005627EC1|nr:alpha/beta hydrolase [Myxosarcina sp. GI1]
MNTGQARFEFLLFAQHGWADTGRDMAKLANTLTNTNTRAIVPSLNWWQTSIRIKPLIAAVETIAARNIKVYPQTPIKIIGHSMGGLIWLEVLNLHPEWWHLVHSLVVIGSPISGADLARRIDPFGIGIAIAGDLGRNRRQLAETIARKIPTLSIVSDLGMGHDGMVTIESSKFAYSKLVLLSDIGHAALKWHPAVVPVIKEFWANPQISPPPADNLVTKLIQRLQLVPGMTDASYQDFHKSQVVISFPHKITLRTWKNLLGVNHIYVAEGEKCLYAGYVGWMETSLLSQTIEQLKQEFA